MKCLVPYFIIPLLFISLVIPSIVAEAQDHVFVIGQAFTLTCSLSLGEKEQAKWFKNNTKVSDVPILSKRYSVSENTLKVSRAVEDDYGVYHCESDSLPNEKQEWRVHSNPYPKFHEREHSVVEGQELKLNCTVVGKPYPEISWKFLPANESTKNESAAVPVYGVGAGSAEGERVMFNTSYGAKNNILTIRSAEKSDAGKYFCFTSEHANATVNVRVKDMYAAVWPFLGIVAEVLVLCVIILVYEKRRTKPDLDDSDADNHDQKKS